MAVAGLVIVKAVVLLLLGRTSLREKPGSLNLAVLISQGGEFAYVVFNLCVGYHIVEQALADRLVVIVTLSMAVTPFLSLLVDRVLMPHLKPSKGPYDVAPTEDSPVIIVGMGRVGQIAARVLRAKHISFTALDIDPEHIEFIKKFGNRVFYGDAARLDLLRAARADAAQVILVAVDDDEASVKIVQHVQQHFPHLDIVARARNRVHAYRLMNMGVKNVMRETFVDSLEMTHAVLTELGLSFSEASTAIERFREHDEALMEATYKHVDDEKRLREIASQARRELESLFESDAQQSA
jgi:glutathione-regulated potassium-efflux system ancillary protein KefC